MAINKDFYRDLPGAVCIVLDRMITQYKKEPWFEEAWQKYRKHVLNSSMDDMKMPGFIFKKYIKQTEAKYSMKGENFKMANEYELYHHGILGMKWGVRRFQNADGSLTAEGKIRYRYDERKGKYVKRSGAEQRKLRKQAKTLTKARKAAEAAKRLKSPRDKNIKEMTDKQLEKYINRMANEKRALELKRDVNQLDPKPLTKGEQFAKKYVDGLIIPDLQKNGSTYVNKLLDMAAKANKQEDKYAQAAKEATYWNNLNNIDNYKKQIEDRKSGSNDKYKEAEKERNYYVNKALALEKKKQYEKLSQTEDTLKSFELKEAIANVINDNGDSTSWRIDYDVKNEKIK